MQRTLKEEYHEIFHCMETYNKTRILAFLQLTFDKGDKEEHE